MLERFVFNCKKKTERNSVSVNLSCGRGSGSRRCVILHPQTLRRGLLVKPAPAGVRSKKPTIITCLSSPRPACFLPDLARATSVCQGRKDFTHLLCNISSVCRKKKKKKKRLRAKERDGPISLKELTNAISTINLG